MVSYATQYVYRAAKDILLLHQQRKWFTKLLDSTGSPPYYFIFMKTCVI